MKRSCFAFHLNSCLNILSFFFIFIFNSNSYKSFIFVSFVSVRSRIVGGTNLYLSYLACLLLECFFFFRRESSFNMTRGGGNEDIET